MPKMKNVTADDFAALTEDLFDAAGYALDYAERVHKGYVDEEAVTLRMVTELVQASRACSSLAVQLLFKLRLAEDRDKTRKILESQLRA